MLFTDSILASEKYLIRKDSSIETITGYCKELNYFNSYLESLYNSMVYLGDITVEDMESYLHYLKEKGNAPASRSRIVYILRSFYNFTYKKDLSEKNLAVKLEPVKIPRKERHYLEESDVLRLFAAIDNDIIGVAAKTLYYTGMRISECLSLALTDVDLEKRVIHVIEGKGKKDRDIPISDRLYDILTNYIDNIRPWVSTENFFATKRTGKLSSQYVNRELKKAANITGIKKKVTAHILRHSFASNLVKRGVNLVKIQKLLGHSSLKVTSIYTHSNLDELSDAVNAL